MPEKTWKDMAFKLSNAAGTLTDISANVNSQALASAITDLDTTGMGVAAKTRVNGIADISVDLNGTLNSTIAAILNPLVNGTSVIKTAEFRQWRTNSTTGKFFNGSVLPSSVQFSGSPDSLETWSATLVFTKAVNVTSVRLT